MSQINPVHALQTYLSSILILSSHLRLDVASGRSLLDFPIKVLYASLLSSIRATRPKYLPQHPILEQFQPPFFHLLRESYKIHICTLWTDTVFPNVTAGGSMHTQ